MTITDEQLAEWERLASEATAGPWRADRDPVDGEYRVVCISDEMPAKTRGQWISRLGGLDAPSRRENATFIAASRSAVPALCTEVRRLRRFLAAVADEAEVMSTLASERRI